jgi:hypothetical protein
MYCAAFWCTDCRRSNFAWSCAFREYLASSVVGYWFPPVISDILCTYVQSTGQLSACTHRVCVTSLLDCEREAVNLSLGWALGLKIFWCGPVVAWYLYDSIFYQEYMHGEACVAFSKQLDGPLRNSGVYCQVLCRDGCFQREACG